MNLASLDDVNRILGYTTGDDTTRDAAVRASLAAVEAWLDGRLLISREGPGVQTYYDIPEDATLRLPSVDAVVTRVRLKGWGGATAWTGRVDWFESELGQGYDLTDEGDVILRPSLLTTPFDNVVGTRALRTWDRVEVYYEGTGLVPRDVTEGVAWLAAGHWSDGPTILQGVTEEQIGDYRYKTRQGSDGGGELGDQGYAVRAHTFLNRHLKRRRVSVT